MSSLRLFKTERFTVLGIHIERYDDSSKSQLPVISLADLLTCRYNSDSMKEFAIRQKLWYALETYGFLILSYSQYSEPGKIIHDLKTCIHTDFFPDPHLQPINESTSINLNPHTFQNTPSYKRPRNVGQLQSGLVYLNERNIPMYKLGYELCDDIREVYRVHAGSPDSQPWPSSDNNLSHYLVDDEEKTSITYDYTYTDHPRSTWLRAMALCRHICDEALHLCLGYDMTIRPGSGAHSWKTPSLNVPKTSRRRPYYEREYLEDRSGDKSVMYAMHYFNDNESILARTSGQVTGTNDITINVKEHTDPSLFVLEPFLADVEGLQVYPRSSLNIPCRAQTKDSAVKDDNHGWIACDGLSSPIRCLIQEAIGEQAMILFVGRAFAEKALEVQRRTVIPTLHRVVGPSMPCRESRRTVIFEQKYEEYFSSDAMD